MSITFDPFLYLPVPLPQKQKILTVFYFAKEPHKTPIKVKHSLHGSQVVFCKCCIKHIFLYVPVLVEHFWLLHYTSSVASSFLIPSVFVCQFLVSVSKENSSTAEVLESISRSVRVKQENLRLAEVGCSSTLLLSSSSLAGLLQYIWKL